MEMVECQEAPSHGKKIYGNLPAARHAPSKKVRSTSYYWFLRSAFLWVKQNYGKIRPDATQIFTDPCRTFFHFQNSVGDHTHAHKRTFEYIQLLFGLHSLRHAMIILLSHLISINYSNVFSRTIIIKPSNHQIISSNHQLIIIIGIIIIILIIIIITILLIVATTIQILLSLSLWCCYVYVYLEVFNILYNLYIYMTICQK